MTNCKLPQKKIFGPPAVSIQDGRVSESVPRRTSTDFESPAYRVQPSDGGIISAGDGFGAGILDDTT